VAIDVDPEAIEAARTSMALNPDASSIEWMVGDYRDRDATPVGDAWEVVLANLTGGMLTSSASRIRELLASGGQLVVSGFDDRERADVETTLGLQTLATFIEDGWVGLILAR
jgi:ribosomal protein L11 methylase PrmA